MSKVIKAFIILSFIFPTLASADITSLWNSCDQQYQKAWKSCNDDYNGKCKYLGSKYKPSCTPGETSVFNRIFQNDDSATSNCRRQYEQAWDKCNARYNGKCTYLGPKFKPDCDLNID